MNVSLAHAIAQDAYVYAYAMLENYRTMFLQVGDPSSADYVGGFGTLRSYSEASTPANHDVVTPNNDTPYSWLWLDLQTEPWVFSVPEVLDGRYYAAQWIDLYTFNFAYVGSHTTGNGAGNYLITGPDWNDTVPAGIDKVFRSETSIVLSLIRTELYGPDDVANVKAMQGKYHAQPISAFLRQPPVATPPPVPWISYNETKARSHDFIAYLNLLLAYCEPSDASEVALRQRFASIGIGPGWPWNASAVDPSLLAQIDLGVADGQKAIDDAVTHTFDSNGLFGTRQELKDDYLKRAVGAAKGLYGNSIEEAWYGGLDGNGTTLAFLHFPPGQLPPAKFFWSITLYTLPDRFLYANEKDHYSLGDRTPNLTYGDGNSLDVYIGQSSPGAGKESNWLPAPASEYFLVTRIYGPEERVLNGSWKLPPLQPVADQPSINGATHDQT